jgi:ribosomal peptide maturation radical SAM protein 1
VVIKSRGPKVLIVVPPFWGTTSPSLGVAQLKANLEAAGHPTDVLHLNLAFARRLGPAAADWISTFGTSTLLGEYVFSAALPEPQNRSIDDYVNEVLDGTHAQRFMQREFAESPATLIARWRDEAVAFCNGEALEAILAHGAWMVGFSSSFQQNCASLALLHRLKNDSPHTVTVMGGANCEGEMGEELMARFPSIDYVGQGECDHSLVELAEALASGRGGDGIPGMRSRRTLMATSPGKPLTSADLDALPYPDFDDFFEQCEALGLADGASQWLVMETARGCWWGAKHHCTFCGLNGGSMGYRSKSPQRVLDEIEWLLERHGPLAIRMADNILDMQYFKTVLPRLAETRRTSIFFETKANLKPDQVRLLAEAGVDRIQPGIESLSDNSLALMRKGTTKMQNVQLLRLCMESGVDVAWNYLLGFPGEDDEEFPAIAEEVESLHHLEPPASSGVLRVDRFSPYFQDPAGFGLAPITPKPAYRHLYPFPSASLARLAYFFEADFLRQKETSPSVGVVSKMVARWRRAHGRSFLFHVPRRKSLVIIDTRRRGRRWVHRLRGLRRAVYERCDRARSLADLERTLGANARGAALETALESLVRDRLLLAANGRYLALGIEPGRPVTSDTGATRRPVPPRVHGRRNVLRSPVMAVRKVVRRQRESGRRLRDRGIRTVVFALVNLLGEPAATGDIARLQSLTEGPDS